MGCVINGLRGVSQRGGRYKIDAEGVHFPGLQVIQERIAKSMAVDADNKIHASLVAMGWTPPGAQDRVATLEDLLRGVRYEVNQIGAEASSKTGSLDRIEMLARNIVDHISSELE